jgi:transcriptional regulator with XRE-family HTH domain
MTTTTKKKKKETTADLLQKHDHRAMMREYRFLNNISQPELAKRLGITQQNYSNIEVGKTMLSQKFIMRFFEVTGVDLRPNLGPPAFGTKEVPPMNECEQVRKENQWLRESNQELKAMLEHYKTILGHK